MKYGERQEPLIKKSGVYFAKAQIVHEVNGAVEAVIRAEDSQKPCVRAEDSQNSYIRIEGLQNSQNSCGSFKRDGAIVRSVVEDPFDDDRILVESGAEPIPTPYEPSELEKMKHELTHTSHSNHGAHRASRAKHWQNRTNESTVSLKTANFPLFSVITLFRQTLQPPTD